MMMLLRDIVFLICQGVLFLIWFSIAGLTAHLGGGLVAGAFGIDDLIPSAVIFFAAVAVIGWIGNRFWPETWL
jgi:hypothetical protein